MKSKTIILAFLLALSFFPLRALAIELPTYDNIPAQVDATTYQLRFQTAVGATITVIGGPADIAPVTDGQGNPADGIVEVTVGLAQEADNVFSVTAAKAGQVSPSMTITIKEGRPTGSSAPRGDTTPPLAPGIDEFPEEVDAGEYVFKGSTEADANVFARWSDGGSAGSTRANSQGIFEVTIHLRRGRTNRINFAAEDGAGNEGPATQAVMRVAALSRGALTQEEMQNDQSSVPMNLLPRFIDIQGHWAENFIKELYAKGYINGKSETKFDPNGEITRAELTKIAINAFSYYSPTVNEKPFRDVAADAWYAPYIKAAKEQGVVQGVGQDFKPNEAISRAAALKILFEASGLPKLTNVQVPFTDIPANAWFHIYVASAVGHDIVSGYANNTFRPGNSITRAEVSKIVSKIKEILQEE